jgi:1-phosphofructokinase family hexose kinase
MIITVTPNAAVDKTLTVPNFQVGFRHRASESLTLPGGKGVNIARAVKTLGQPVIVTGLIGGRAGQQIVEGLARENILNDFVRIAGESRTSTAVIDSTNMSQTEIIEYGPVVTAQELATFLDEIDHLAKGAQYVILAGSLPRKVPEDFYAQVLQRLAHRRCFTVLDSVGEPLRLGVRGKPNLVSSNLREAEDLVGHEFHDEQDIIDATGIIHEMGAQNVIIRVPDGCVARIRQGRRDHVYRAAVPRFESVVSTVGSGDASLAGFVASRFQKQSFTDALRSSVACGAANTQSNGACVFEFAAAEQLMADASVTELRSPTRA